MNQLLELSKYFKVTIIKKIQQAITNSLEPSEKNGNFSKEIEVVKKNQMEIKELKNNRNNITNWMSSLVQQR